MFMSSLSFKLRDQPWLVFHGFGFIMETWSAMSFRQVIAVKISDNKCEYIL